MHPAKLTLIKNVLNLRALRILIIFTPTIIHSYRSKGSWRFDSCVSFRVLVGAVWKGDVSPRGVQTSQVPIFPRVCLLWCWVINVINALLLTRDCISPICISRATYPQNWNQLLRDRKGIGIPFCAVTRKCSRYALWGKHHQDFQINGSSAETFCVRSKCPIPPAIGQLPLRTSWYGYAEQRFCSWKRKENLKILPLLFNVFPMYSDCFLLPCWLSKATLNSVWKALFAMIAQV